MYRLFKLLAALSYVVAALAGLSLCFRYLLGALGVLAALAGVVLFPVTLAVVPLVALLRSRQVAPFLAVYAGLTIATVLHWLARGMEARARGGEPDGGGG